MLFENIRFAMRAVFQNPLRSILTLIGITFGVAAVVIVSGVGEGFRKNFEEGMGELGTNLLLTGPGRMEEGALKGQKAIKPFTLEDAEALEDAPHVRLVAPEVGSQGLAQVGRRNTNVTIRGVTPSYQSVRSYELERGRFLNPLDIAGKRRSVVIGKEVWSSLFPGLDPIGESLRIRGIPFEVVGILAAKGGQGGGGGFSSADDLVLLPISTARTLFVGGRSIHIANVEATSLGDLPDAEREVKEILRQRHQIRFGESDDFWVFNSGDIVEQVNKVLGGFNMFLLAIGGISLLIGGIGIMNIMLVTVTERTGEIGLRKAVGARGRDILLQFLVEAIVLSFLGGLVGMGMGYLGIWGIGRIPGFPGQPIFSVSVFTVAAGVSMAVGLIFGLLPARQAAKLDPIVALRRD